MDEGDRPLPPAALRSPRAPRESLEQNPGPSPDALCRAEAARRRAAFLRLEDGELHLEVREPAEHLAKALRAKGFAARPTGAFTLAVAGEDWERFWREAGPLIDCGC